MTTIVIPLSACGGRLGDDTELRYALRSLETHFRGEFEVAIVGEKAPAWLRVARHVPCGQGLKTALKVAAETFPEGFFWWYDDTCLLMDANESALKVTPADPHWRSLDTAWGRDLARIRTRLESIGVRAWDYSRPHGPYWFDKGMVDEAFDDWPGMSRKFPFETWILSKHGWPRRQGVVQQYYGPFRGPPDRWIWFLNYADAGNTPELRDWLATRFPKASRFEPPHAA